MFPPMLDDKPRLEAVTERDIDILLMEEFEGGSGFLDWFVSVTVGWPLAGFDVLGAWHSVSTDIGESDLLVLAHRPGRERLALLIENKVDAPPQPEQSRRYLRRGEAGLKDGEWQQFATCIVAPQRYLGAAANAEGYQYPVSYEDIAEWMRANLPPGRRTEFRLRLILAAIEQQRRGYSPKIDPVVTRFFSEYWELAENLFPELRFSQSGARPAESTWAEFRPARLPKGRQILHKVHNGCVDLQLSGCGLHVDELTALNAALLRDGLEFARAARSAALRVAVPKMDVRGDFSTQREAALTALKAAYKLASLMHLVRTE
jgi:hypothetical protein